LYNWHTLQIDFVLAYPQADVECKMYMKIPRGFEIDGKPNKTHVLKLLKNLYGQKQAGRVWNQHLQSTQGTHRTGVEAKQSWRMPVLQGQCFVCGICGRWNPSVPKSR
jgi:hypothetical protein